MDRILVIEDSKTQAVQLEFTLREAGWDVALAHDLQSGLQRIDEQRPDALLLDLILPDVEGLQGLERIRELQPELPIVVLTGLEDEAVAVRALQAGAQDYVVKGSADSTLLLRTVRHAMERQRIAGELEEKNAQLEALNAEKDRFLGMATHDLRTPLSVISAYASFLAASELSDEQQQFIERMRHSADFMLRLVDDLLDMSAIHAGQLKLDRAETDLGELIERNVALNRLLAERKDISVTFQAPESAILALLDASKIEQVLNNLISNAVKYSHEGTTVRVALTREGEQARLEITDQGQGIPCDEVDQLFRPFGRTSVKTTAGEKSTGLGLAIVQTIVIGHGGRIEVESEVGEGTTVTIFLPLDAGEAPPA